mmetsp:Transcript_58142/g.103266  ORF Transcript_58142/g.103266 Transcript_58142/m.103266 type:complete len:669 (-) Transcript_58142:134-2140(-)
MATCNVDVLRALLFTFLALSGAAHGEEDAYDFIVVGGGAAGCVLANRLSESGQHSVLLLNVAGPPPDAYRGPVLISDELIVKKNMSSSSGLAVQINQPGYSPVRNFSVSKTGSSPARWLGGSSLVGLSIYLRDHPETLDAWGEGWGWKEMQKYFHKVENLAASCYGGNQSCGDYGTAGPVKIAKEPSYTHPLTMDFIAAARAAGLPETRELNTHHGRAVGVPPTVQDKGNKVHAFDAYLRPAIGRANLHVRHGARADRLVLNGRKCQGVAYRDLLTSRDQVVKARKEVILSSGYIYSPRLLFLSGLGPKEELEKVGLNVALDLPAVGQHLTSARYSPLTWKTERPTLSQMMGQPISHDARGVPEAYQSTVQEAFARFRSKQASKKEPKATRSDIVLTFMPLYQAPASAPLQFSLQGEPWPLKTNAYTILATLSETAAKGRVTFPTAAPDESPVVTHDALTDADWELAQEAVEFAMGIGNQSALGGTFFRNGAGARDGFSAIYDGRGSCRMGRDGKDSVVDKRLRVHGIDALRVADGSVIPQASPYLALPEVLALAERAADLVLGDHEEHEMSNSVKRARVLLIGQRAAYRNMSIQHLKEVTGQYATLMEMVKYVSNPAQAELATGSSAPPPAILAMVALFACASLVVAWLSKQRQEACPEHCQEPLLA